MGTRALLLLGLGLVAFSLAHAYNQVIPKNPGLRDYCQFESFDAQCGADEVILMEVARFGRMRIGRCVNRDYGFIGCTANVLGEMDRRCSGRRQCNFPIPDLREIYQPCPKDLTAFLEASYTCVKVANLLNSTSSCSWRRPITLTDTSGYISSLPLTERGYGSARCPMVIQAQPGQSVNLTLFSFNLITLGAPTREDKCPYSGVIRESGSSTNVSIPLCAAGDRRQEGLFLSTNHSVTLHIERSRGTETTSQVLLQYQVVGCPDPRAPRNAWMQRAKGGDKAVIKCNHTSETWYLTCRGHAWVGSVSNCTKVSPWSTDDETIVQDSFPLGLLIAVAIGVIVGIIMGIVMLVFVFYYRRKERMRKLRHKAKTLLDDETSQENEENYARRLMHGEGGLSPTKHANIGCHSDYTQMWELRRSQPLLQPSGEPTPPEPAPNAAPAASTISAPPCCNKTTFITFKPRDPIYERSRFSALLHKNLNGVPLYFEYEPGASGERPAGQAQGDATYKRPDLLTNSGKRASDAGQQGPTAAPRSVKFRDERRCSEGQRDMCDHCALHASSERILDEPAAPAVEQPAQPV